MSSPSGGSGEDGGEDDERILLTINGATYDVTDYAPVHPGEGRQRFPLPWFLICALRRAP